MLQQLCGAVVLAVNQGFVTLLFGSANFGGVWLTIGFVLQMILGGQAFLSNYLFRATGRVREGSFLLAGEALLRVAAMSAALLAIGLAGAPWAAAAVSAAALVITLRRLDRELPPAGVRRNPHFMELHCRGRDTSDCLRRCGFLVDAAARGSFPAS